MSREVAYADQNVRSNCLIVGRNKVASTGFTYKRVGGANCSSLPMKKKFISVDEIKHPH